VGLSILTQRQATIVASAIGLAGHGPFAFLSAISGLGLALLIGVARRRTPLPLGRLLMVLALLGIVSGVVACSSSVKLTPATPAGSYSVTVTASGSTGSTSSFTVPLTVN
jgi:disulfide bond formation protein DsbB